jgi:hypothetical protein
VCYGVGCVQGQIHVNGKCISWFRKRYGIFFITFGLSASQELCSTFLQFALHLIGLSGGFVMVTARTPKLSTRRFGHCPPSSISPNKASRTGSVPSPAVKGTNGPVQ